MTKQPFVLLLALVGACTASEPPAVRPAVARAGIGIDHTWARLGLANVAAHEAVHLGVDVSLAGRQAYPPPDAPAQPAPDHALDWQFTVDAPVNATPALHILGTTADPNDQLFAAAKLGGNFYIGAANNLYATAPTIAWGAQIDSDVDGSAINISIDGSAIYAVTTAGTVYALATSNGAVLWTASLAKNAGVSWASPWLDFQSTPNYLYVADLKGNVTKIDTSTGKQAWSRPACGAPIHSSPIVWNDIVWVGCDDGLLYRLDPATGNAYPPGTKLCFSGRCGANDAIWSGPAIDVTNNRLLVGVDRGIVQVDISPTTGCSTGATACTVKRASIGFTSAIFYSSPTIDANGGYVYAAYNNRLWRAPYTAADGIAGPFDSRRLTGSSSNMGYPKSSPMVFNGYVWIGDGGGYVNRFATTPTWKLEATTPQYGVTIDTTPLIDYAGGNIYYGTNGAGNVSTPVNPNQGSWVQLAQNWTF